MYPYNNQQQQQQNYVNYDMQQQPQGGFVHNQTGFDSPSNTDSPSGKKKFSGPVNQSLTPLTIKQVLNASNVSPDDSSFKVDGKELNQITIVGVIQSASENTTNLSFNVEDGTGSIEVRIWLDAEEHSDNRPQFRPGNYVRVIGNLRSFMNKKSIIAFRLLPITDFNEITYHFIEVIYVHLYNLKGPLNSQATNAQNYSMNQQQQSFGNPYLPAHTQINQVPTSFRDQVLATFRIARGNAQGVSVFWVAQQLGKPDSEVRKAIEFLTEEAHLYQTIDEDHYTLVSK